LDALQTTQIDGSQPGPHSVARAWRSLTNVSSGDQVRHRLSRAGNRRINHALHMMAVTQIRYPGSAGRQYYERKRNEGKTPKEALRCLKRRLSDPASGHQPRQLRSLVQTTRTFQLGPGRATRTFTFRERGGVILLNQLTVRHDVRAFVVARIPHLAGAEVWSWASRNRPSASCRRHGALDICTQGEEWCPIPPATWHFRLVKLAGPAGLIRFAYVVAPPPKR
jgi:hypothetical protein